VLCVVVNAYAYWTYGASRRPEMRHGKGEEDQLLSDLQVATCTTASSPI